MKKMILLFTLFTSMYAHAQINVGSKAISTGNDAGRLSENDINELKKTTTLFTLQWKDYDHVQDFEKVIAEVWKVTKYKIIKPNEMAQYTGKEGYSFFSFGGYYLEKTHSITQQKSLFTIHLTYDLWMPDINKKGIMKGEDFYSRTMMSPDADAFKQALTKYRSNFSERMMEYVYRDAVFNNWGAGFLKGYLSTINDYLSSADMRGIYTSDQDDDALKKLKTDTLYIPDYVNTHFSPYTGAEKDDDKDESDIKEYYPHPVKYVTAQQLNEMIVARNDAFYYMVYVRIASDKFVDVYRNEKGMVFARYTPMSYNFKNKDISKIDNAIR